MTQNRGHRAHTMTQKVLRASERDLKDAPFIDELGRGGHSRDLTDSPSGRVEQIFAASSPSGGISGMHREFKQALPRV